MRAEKMTKIKFFRIGCAAAAAVFLLSGSAGYGQTQGKKPAAAKAGQAKAAQAAKPGSKPSASKKQEGLVENPASAPGQNVLSSSSVPVKPAAPKPQPSPSAPSPTGADKPKAEGDQIAPVAELPPQPIVIDTDKETLEERLAKKITLDVRDMSVVDILRFLALKGNINIAIAGNTQGRTTLALKSVSIKDALDLVILLSSLAYVIENDIIRVMSDQEYQMTYGKPFNDQQAVAIIRLKYAKPGYVLTALDNLKSNIGRIIIDEDTGSVAIIDTPKSIERMKEAIQEIEVPLEPIVYSLQYAKADVTADKLRARLDAHAVGSITVDERSNKLVVRAFPKRRAEVEKLIKSLDAPTKEVLVEARILQVAFKPQFDLGIDWNVDFRNSSIPALRKIKFSDVMMAEPTMGTSSNLFTNYGRVGIGTVNVDAFQMAIRALKQVSDTKVLANPRLLVTNNEEAHIHVGDTIPYIISTTSGTGDNAITSEDVRFVDVGLKLSLTPTINDDGFVTMILKPEISTVTGSVTSRGGGIPQINKTLVETTVMVKDGMTVVMGGLKKEIKTQLIKGVPLLMDVPVIKRFFSSTKDSIESTEIVIFITPHILTGDKDLKELQGDIKSAKEYEAGDKKEVQEQALKIKE